MARTGRIWTDVYANGNNEKSYENYQVDMNQRLKYMFATVLPQGLETTDSPTFSNLTVSNNLYIGSTGTYLYESTGDIHLTVDANKTLVLDETVYDDLQFPVSTGKVPSLNAPTWEAFTTNTSEYGFAVDDYIDLHANEVPHTWKEGTQAEIHAHITTKAANATGNNRYAKFTVYVSYVDIGEVWVETEFTKELTIPDGTAALTSLFLYMGDLALTNYLIGAEIKVRVKRIAATGGIEYAGNIFINQVGSHLEHDTLGSRQIATK